MVTVALLELRGVLLYYPLSLLYHKMGQGQGATLGKGLPELDKVEEGLIMGMVTFRPRDKWMSKLVEIGQELRAVLAGRGNLVDAVVPPLIFVLLNALLGFPYALWGALAVALSFTILRFARGQNWRYALGGLGGVLVAVLLARLLGRAEGYFIPSILSSAGTVLLCLVSVVAGRPLVAWTSFLTRRWPLEWYWHPRVCPAYSEVTWAWSVYFALRLGLQLLLLRNQESSLLGLVQVVLGWPATIVLLVLSYLYGTWRLRRLEGPSVEEFRRGDEPPWEGQRRGF
jgi:hypothetical protein